MVRLTCRSVAGFHPVHEGLPDDSEAKMQPDEVASAAELRGCKRRIEPHVVVRRRFGERRHDTSDSHVDASAVGEDGSNDMVFRLDRGLEGPEVAAEGVLDGEGRTRRDDDVQITPPVNACTVHGGAIRLDPGSRKLGGEFLE
jgi:hypothetical protein